MKLILIFNLLGWINVFAFPNEGITKADIEKKNDKVMKIFLAKMKDNQGGGKRENYSEVKVENASNIKIVLDVFLISHKINRNKLGAVIPKYVIILQDSKGGVHKAGVYPSQIDKEYFKLLNEVFKQSTETMNKKRTNVIKKPEEYRKGHNIETNYRR